MKKIVNSAEEEIQQPEIVESKPLEEPTAQPTEKKSNKTVLIVVVILIIVLIGLFMYWNYSRKQNKNQDGN